jgi:hypothetical protein
VLHPSMAKHSRPWWHLKRRTEFCPLRPRVLVKIEFRDFYYAV